MKSILIIGRLLRNIITEYMSHTNGRASITFIITIITHFQHDFANRMWIILIWRLRISSSMCYGGHVFKGIIGDDDDDDRNHYYVTVQRWSSCGSLVSYLDWSDFWKRKVTSVYAATESCKVLHFIRQNFRHPEILKYFQISSPLFY